MENTEFREAAGRHLLAVEQRDLAALTLVFERRDGRWLMVLDQNTPRR